MDGHSQSPLKERLEALQNIIPEAFSEGKIDWEKLKATLGEEVNFSNERYVLNWAGKSDAFRTMQQPSAATLVPCKEESVDFDTTENIFIEGENMEVLKVLQKSYFGKVKMIYIDPPYNTGNDSFIYPDRFSETKEDYQKRVGDLVASNQFPADSGKWVVGKDSIWKANRKENGQYHSNWLNMMMPRLYLAKSLLRDDGVIFISIDDNEVHNLRLLMNEIFGEENFVAQLIWERAYSPKNDARFVSNSHDYILMFAKQIENFQIGRLERTEAANARYTNPDNDPRGVWKPSDLSVKTYTESCDYPITTPSGKIVEPPAGRCWRLSKNAFFERLQDNRIWFGPNGDSVPCMKRFLSELKFEGMAPTSILYYKEVGHSQEGAQEVTKLLEAGAFDGPKPVRLLRRLLTLANLGKDSIILDFFAGSGTTAHAVMQLNKEDGGHRKFICVQLPELCDEKSEAYKAGYSTIAEISKERIRRAGAKLASPPTPLHVERGASAKENLFKGATPDLFSKANELRIERKTEAEDVLWQHLRNRQVENCKFRRQHPLGHFIADFYCHEKRLVIEVDGGYHLTEEQKAYDEARTEAINQYGIQVVRFTNEQVLTDMDYVISEIRNVLASHPLPSPQGEGQGEVDLGFKVFKLQDSNFKQWRNIPGANKEEWKQQIIDFINPIAENATVENMMYELLLKSGKSLNSKIEHTDNCYCINGGELALLLESVSQTTVDAVLSRHPQKVIALDKLFEGNDQLKTNTALQMRDAGVEFKTI